MKATVIIAALLGSTLTAGDAKRVYIDPASRWISIHDQTGSGARAEVTADILKACPSTILLVDDKSTAAYTVAIDRTGTSAGSVQVYVTISEASGTQPPHVSSVLVNSFVPGHTATLKTVAERICDYVRKN